MFLGTFKGKRVWLLPDGRVEVMFEDRPVVFAKSDLRADMQNWLAKRGV